jgi:serine/threonine protein kinase
MRAPHHTYHVLRGDHGSLRLTPAGQWCDARSLDVEVRLRLFVAVCLAVPHAQQNLVLHRDPEPANALVTAGGVAKLLDFGIAEGPHMPRSLFDNHAGRAVEGNDPRSAPPA